uniref:Protein furry n=1 Tax=Aceria tosichella TaxID=561515 RepID=A0A6G1S3B7_9ACAR
MDSLKLDRFRRLLNRQNTSINLSDSTQQQQASTGPTTQQQQSISTTTSNTLVSTKSSGIVSNAPTTVTLTQLSLSAILVNTHDHIFKDNPRPAHFIARKLFCDFTEIIGYKIDTVLAKKQDQYNSATATNQQHPKDASSANNGTGNNGLHRSIFESLQRDEDLVYDQILRSLSTVSEYCLPSLLKYLLLWYHQQLEAYAETYPPKTDDCFISGCGCGLSPEQDAASIGLNQSTEISVPDQQPSSSSANTCDQALAAECGCISPCNIESHSLSNSISLVNNNPTLRSPTPSSPDASGNQISITSTLPLDYQSPVPITTSIQKDECQQQQQQQQQQPQSGSAANTSTSTATNTSLNSTTLEDSNILSKRLEFTKARKILIEYAFCQALIEIFGKLYLHPGHEDLIGQIENIAFEHFNYEDETNSPGIDPADIRRLSHKYADLVGVLAQTRFKSVKKRFLSELADLKLREPTTQNIQCLCSLLAGMRSFRIKMAPIEEFEASFQFLQELADYFVDVRHKSIKHALADLFVEILLPLASTVKNEVKIPCLKNFVDTLWTPTLDMCARKKHSSTIFPLVTCLLCLSQRAIFLQNWSPFLQMCLSSLKNRDQKMCRIALESLYRLIWIYMIRIKGESNNVTQAKLNSIVDSLFPRGSRQIVPRDTSLVIFVDIIQFIAQERLDFAMRHIIFDLLSVDRSIKMIMSPERMNIGLQAFLVIADNLQQKEGDPAMPISIGSASAQQLASIMHSNPLSPSPSTVSYQQQQQQLQNDGGTFGPRRACALKMLNDDTAKSIGLHPYYNHIQRSFNEILKALDAQFGRPLMLTSVQTINKEPDDMISGDRKLKVELFRTCIAAIPRLMPEGMSKTDLIDLLSRMTIHIDEQMRRYAFESLLKLVTEFQDWRLDAIEGFTLFLANQIDESLRALVDGALRMLLQFLISWHSIIKPSSNSSQDSGGDFQASGIKPSPIVMIQTGYETISSRNSGTGGQIVARKNRALAEMRLIQSELSNTRFDRLISVIQKVEGASLVMSCSCHSATRKLASLLLRECRAILKCYSSWTCMEHFGFRSPDDGEEEDLSVGMKGSLSADNLSRITTTSINGLVSSSMTSMNTQALLSTSVSKMCISSGTGQQQQQQHLGNLINSNANNNNNNNQHDLYGEDVENNIADYYSDEENSTLVFWVAVMLLDSDKEHEYTLALSLLRKILPNMPFEKEEFLEELDRNLKRMEWTDYPGIHSLVLKRCTSASTYDVCISLLDHMTPILRHNICTGNNNKPSDWLPAHLIVLSAHLLTTYEDPPSFSLNIARRLALCCEENSQKLENLSAVMTLYSRRSFSKDAFQWIKCVAKYLHDAYPNELPNTIPLLLEMLEGGPQHVQRLTLPMLYCILTYVDLNASPVELEEGAAIDFNAILVRLYNKCLGTESLWRDAMQIFRLIISKSSSLANGTTGRCHELPGRTMEFSIDMDNVPVIAKSRLAEFGVTPNVVQVCSATKLQQQRQQQQQQQQQRPPPPPQPHLAVDNQA